MGIITACLLLDKQQIAGSLLPARAEKTKDYYEL
jgi:hypothetical protein